MLTYLNCIQGQKMETNRNIQPAFRLTPSISNFTQVCESRHALLEAIQEEFCSEIKLIYSYLNKFMN